jgi:diguanylate cyclase (GGDEF)-like protein
MILDKSKEAVSAQKASMMLLNKDTQMLEVKVVRGIDPIEEAKINRGEVETTRIKIGEGVAGKVAATKKPMLINKVAEDKTFKKSDRSNVNSIICMPLVANDECIGVMNITNKLSGENFEEEDVEFLTTLSGQAAITIYNAQLYHLAITDGLTQLHIHRYFEQRLHDEFVRASRKHHEVSVIMSDIDHFKKFNDTYGHQQGDLVLIHTAKLFKLNVRDMDVPCRYGGEEYAIILPETGMTEAVQVAERIRTKIEEYDFPGTKPKEKLKVTISLGVATFPLHAKNEHDLVKSADSALYFSKEHGRNKVSIAGKDGLIAA